MAVNDKRRDDVRTNVRANPFWMVSAEFGKDDAGDNVILFDFPEVLGDYFVHELVVKVVEAFTDADGITGIGRATVNDDLVLDNADADEFMASGEITANATGIYPGGAWTLEDGTPNTVTGTDWGKAKATGTIGNLIIKGADYADDMPVIYATVKAGQTAGRARVYALVSRIV